MGADQPPEELGPDNATNDDFDPDAIDWSKVPLDDPRWDLLDEDDFVSDEEITGSDEEIRGSAPNVTGSDEEIIGSSATVTGSDAETIEIDLDAPLAADDTPLRADDAPLGPPPDPSQRTWRHPSEVAAANAHMQRFLAEDARAKHPASRQPVITSRIDGAANGTSGRLLLAVAAGAIVIAGVSIWNVSREVVVTDAETAAVSPAPIAVISQSASAENSALAPSTTLAPVEQEATPTTNSSGFGALIAQTVAAPPAWAYEVLSGEDDLTSATLASAIRLDGLDPEFLITSASALGSRSEVKLAGYDFNGEPMLMSAALVGSDVDSDIAVLRVDVADAGDESASVGSQSLYELGSPIEVRPGVPVKPHSGTILSISQNEMTTSAPVPVGHLGAAIVNSNGSVVGMVVAGSSMLATAIPADEARRIASNIADYGVANPNWLGITITNVDGLAEVVSVVEGSPAADAGLLPGDRLIGAGGQIIVTTFTTFSIRYKV